MNVYRRIVLGALTAWIAAASPFTALAQSASTTTDGFNPNAILQDRDLFDVTSMSKAELDAFLNSRGTLGTARVVDIDGVEKSPADVIWRVAHSYKINPKYLLALMQKEQSLVESRNPTQKQFDWAMGYGVCDSCSMNDPAIQAFKGFANQVEWAAKQHREKYLLQLLGRGTTISGFAPGKTALVNGVEITPENQATAMLYTYTPHIHGNKNLWRIWTRWFSLTFPDGTIVRGKSTKTAYLIRNGKKRPFKNNAVLASIADPSKIVTAEDSELAAYPEGTPINFPNYAIVENASGTRYLITGSKRRKIASASVFRKFGFNEDEIIEADETDLEEYEVGPDINAKTVNPVGILAKDSKGKLFYVEDGKKYAIPDTAYLRLYFRGRTAKLLTTAQLGALEDGGTYRLRDGELVRTKEHPSVYVLENGIRRPILSADVFETLGWDWKNVVVLPEKTLAAYPIGAAVEAHGPSLLAEPVVAVNE